MNLSRLYYLPGVRERYARIRHLIFTRSRGIEFSNDTTSVTRIPYSEENIRQYRSLRERVDFLVSWVGFTARGLDKKLLVIGPRFETELLGYQSLGFKKKNIYSIDTFSYSPRIKVGNMHKLEFKESSMHLVVCGWVIVYSSNVVQALKELARVISPGGLLFLTFDVEEGITPTSYWDVKVSSYDKGPISFLLQEDFELYSQFLGKTSWSSQKDIGAFVLKRRSSYI